MTTQVSIIKISLDTDINQIISENVDALTGQAKQELDLAIESAKQRDRLREKKASAKKGATDAVTKIMDTAYQQLIVAGADGVLCADIMSIVDEHIKTTSAFTLRMKKILRDQGNLYALTRKTINKNSYYIFNKYNQ